MWQFFFSSCFCFCYYFFEWVNEWVSEWVSCVAPTIVSSGSPHRVWERERESQRERSGVYVCVCVRQYTCLHQYMHARNTHWLSRTHDMHSTFALLLLCSALPRHPLKSSLALRSSSQSNLNNDTERFGVLSLSLSFSASKTFSLLKCPKAAATIFKILLPAAAAAAAVVVAANAQWALRAAAATTKV